MIKQIYTINNETFTIIIEGKIVKYFDRKLKVPIQLIPQDPKVSLLIKNSRNKIDQKLIKQFTLTKEEQKQYDKAMSEEDLAKICRKDCESNSARLLKEEKDGCNT